MRKYASLLLIALGISLQISPSAFGAPTQFSTEEAEVIIFHPGMEHGSPRDIASFAGIATRSEFSVRTVDYRFITKREAFFDGSGKKKFKVLIMGGGEGHNWFRKALDEPGITCAGVKNLMNFIETGGAVIAICICGSALFASQVEWLNPNEKEAQMGLWDRTHSNPGHSQTDFRMPSHVIHPSLPGGAYTIGMFEPFCFQFRSFSFPPVFLDYLLLDDAHIFVYI